MLYRSDAPASRRRRHSAAGSESSRGWRSWPGSGRLLALLGAGGLVLIAASSRAPSATATSGWSAWTAVAGPTAVAPAITFDTTDGTLELASVGADLGVMHNRFTGGKWNTGNKTAQSSAMPPALLVDSTGTPRLLVTGSDGSVTDSRFQGGAWSAPVPTGAKSALPPVAAVNPAANALELITVGTDGSVSHSRFLNDAWSSPTPLNVTTSLLPALVANAAGGLELAVVESDGLIYHARFADGQWSDFTAMGIGSDMAPALAISADGVLHLVATDADHRVEHSRFVNDTWRQPVDTGLQSNLAPSLAYNSASNELELLAADLDGVVEHARYTHGAWTTPVSVGLATVTRPALTATAAGAAVAVVGKNGKVYSNQFQTAAAPYVPVTFSKDVLRIFTNNGGKTCATSRCHGGSRPTQGLSLEKDQAYDNIVSVSSSESSDNLVEPGDASASYLYRKVNGGPDISGHRMPDSGGALAAADIERIRQWIDAGAPNN
jgi:hypothetical protein